MTRWAPSPRFAPPLLAALPQVLHLPAADAPPLSAVAASLHLMDTEVGRRDPGARAVVARMIDILFVRVLRGWLAGDGRPDEPVASLTRWRMELAARALRDGETWKVCVTSACGCRANPAFSFHSIFTVGKTVGPSAATAGMGATRDLPIIG